MFSPTSLLDRPEPILDRVRMEDEPLGHPLGRPAAEPHQLEDLRPLLRRSAACGGGDEVLAKVLREVSVASRLSPSPFAPPTRADVNEDEPPEKLRVGHLVPYSVTDSKAWVAATTRTPTLGVLLPSEAAGSNWLLLLPHFPLHRFHLNTAK